MAEATQPTITQPTILQILPALGYGGVEQGTVEIASALQRAGVRALVASASGPLLPLLLETGAEHVLLPFTKNFSPLVFARRVQALRRLIRREKVKLVHARSRLPAWVAVVACKLEGVPLVTTWHGVHEAKNPFKRFYNSGLTRGSRVIAVSEEIGRRVAREYAFTSDRVRVIARGSDLERFNPALFAPKTAGEARVRQLRENWNIPANAQVLLLPARLTRWKGHGVLVEALGLLAVSSGEVEWGDSWHCILAGPAESQTYVEELRHRIKELGFESRVKLVGPCTDMPAAYALADIVIAPSLRPEPFGRVAVEAQMMGCAIVASMHGGQAETVLEGKSGILLPSGDVRALSAALVALLSQQGTKEQIQARQQARKRAGACYATEKMQAATLAVYDEVLGADRPRKAVQNAGLEKRFLERVREGADGKEDYGRS